MFKKPKNHSQEKVITGSKQRGRTLQKQSPFGHPSSGTSKSLTTPSYPKMIKTGTSKLNGRAHMGKVSNRKVVGIKSHLSQN